MVKVFTVAKKNRISLFADRNAVGLGAIFVFLVLLAFYLRYKLIAAETFDYNNFLLPWYNFLKTHGLHGFRENFANYNTPYLFLIWIVTHLPVGPLAGIKLISIGFDFVLAAAVFLVVGHYRPEGYARYLAFLTVLYVPTVFLNSSLWGQCDAIYTSFGLLGFYFCLRDKQFLAWGLWGVAFAFKLQAIFFLPFLVFYFFYKRWRWYSPLVAVAVIALLSVLPILEGRSIASTLNIYILQAKDPVGGQPALAWYSATFGQLLPSGGFFYPFFKEAMLIFGVVAGVATIAFAFLRDKYTQQQLLYILALSLFAIPFLLPGIHERYMFSAEVIALVCAFILPGFAWVAIVMQVVTTITYDSYFTGARQAPVVPYAILALAVLGIIYWIAHKLYNSLIVIPPATRQSGGPASKRQTSR